MLLVTLGLLAAALLPGSSAHSWNEQISLIDDKGNFISNGYPRGYVARTDPGFNGNSMMWMLPSAESKRSRIDSSDFVCHTNQRTKTQPPKYPRVQVAPGSTIAMKYLENGHVTQPLNQKGKQLSGGSVFVFGTTQPKDDAKLMDVLQWTTDGTGGDKSGRLLAAQNYDDGRCYQIAGAPISTERQSKTPNFKPGQSAGTNELWCDTYVTMPKDLPQGQGAYTLYWVWDWRTLNQQQASTEGGGQQADPGLPNGKDEFYTTCSDFDVVAQPPAPAFDKNQLGQQDPMSKAAPDYLNNIMGALVKSPGAEPSPVYATAGAGGAPQPTSAAPPAPQAPAPVATTPAAAPVAASPAPAASAPAPSAVTPLPMSAFKPAVSGAAAASGKPSDKPSTPATPAAPSGMKTIAVPAGASVFVLNKDGVMTQVHKRAEATTFAKLPRSVVHAHGDAHRY